MLNNNLAAIIQKFRESRNLDRETWKNFSIFLARLHLEAAPGVVRAQFTGPLSDTPPESRELAEIFAMLQIHAEDRAGAANVLYSPAQLWAETLRLREARP